MADLLTTEETASAARAGWQMCLVYDLAQSSWSCKALPLAFGEACPHVPSLLRQLILGAKTGDKLALRALQLAAQPAFSKQKVTKK